uniref:Uncharacterized protein n=1 Tax=Anopheles melas TaxID=34690 RepID=A0A182UD90_9DIPT
MLLHVVVALMPDTNRASPRIQIGISMSVDGVVALVVVGSDSGSVDGAGVVLVAGLGGSSVMASYASSVSSVPLPSESGLSVWIGLGTSRFTVPRPVPQARGSGSAVPQPAHPTGSDCSSRSAVTTSARKLPPREVDATFPDEDDGLAIVLVFVHLAPAASSLVLVVDFVPRAGCVSSPVPSSPSRVLLANGRPASLSSGWVVDSFWRWLLER